MPAQVRKRCWVWTCNNYTDADKKAILAIDYRYVCWGHETGGKTGTPHLQGYISFTHVRTFQQVRKLMPRQVGWIDYRKGSIPQAENYQKKDGDWFEDGDRPIDPKKKGEMEKVKWAEILKAAKEGDWEWLELEHPQVWCHMEAKLRAKYKPTKIRMDGELEHMWIWGSPGTGKTTWVLDKYPDCFMKDLSKWWDRYDSEDTVFIDEWSPDVKLDREIKIWADRTSFNAEVKGGGMSIRPKRIIICSNYTIAECFSGVQREAVERRFKQVFIDVLKKEEVAKEMDLD